MLNLKFVPLQCSLCVKTSISGKMESKWVCHAYLLFIEGHKITMDLVFLNISTFDVIIGMDWLARHHAIVDCYLKKITFQSLDDSYMSFHWN